MLSAIRYSVWLMASCKIEALAQPAGEADVVGMEMGGDDRA